jgi:putative phage-type endonuclease
MTNKLKIHNFDQCSEEWFKIRAGKFTGSDFHIMLGKSQTKTTNLYKKASEIITGKPVLNGYTNEHIERGKLLEKDARDEYALETGNSILEVGFCELNKFTGCSPDGLVGDDGIIEIKCPCDYVFLKVINKDKIKPEYITQIQFNLFVTNRNWCDFICFNENYKKQIYINRVERDNEYIEAIKEELENCIEEVKNIVETYNNKLNIKKEEVA